MSVKDNKFMLFGIAAAALALLYLVKKKGAAADVGEAVGRAVLDAAAGVTAGVVYGVGDAVGLPRTNMTECEKAIAEGRTWDASFACPAKDFISSVFSHSPISTPSTFNDRRNEGGGSSEPYNIGSIDDGAIF